MSANPYITIIIPVYNGAHFLPTCLDAITSSTYRSFEIIAVDDCSTDASAEICKSYGARVLSTTKQSGPGAARNLAAESANGEILFFVDADVVVQPETIALVADRFEKQPQISALFGSYDDEPAEKNFLSQYKNLQHHFVHQNSSSEASTFWAGLGAIRRDVFLKFGGFDCKKFGAPMIEDIDLGFRLKKAGNHILLDPTIQAKHLKKWKVVGHLRTEILCRALPWSRLILEEEGMINDMNLKTQDRLSAVLLAISLLLLPFAIWKPAVFFVLAACLIAIVILNRQILTFYARKRGVLFALMTVPWQLLYFFYSGVVFVLCWFWYRIPRILGMRTSHETNTL
jgi:glycosyltransferase involved in cell wall biosynthesis